MDSIPQTGYQIRVADDGLVHVDGLCIGRGRIVEGRLILEVRDRMKVRAIDRGRQDVPVDLMELVSTLNRELARRNGHGNNQEPGQAS